MIDIVKKERVLCNYIVTEKERAMVVKGWGVLGYPADYGTKSRKGVSEKSYSEKTGDKNVPQRENSSKQMSVEDIFDKMKQGKKEIEKAETESDIIVKPDGSRVLVVTTSVGGMQTSMSLEISKPTDMPNGTGQDGEDDSAQTLDMQAFEVGGK